MNTRTAADRALLTQQVLEAQRALARALLQGTVPDWLGLDLTMSQLKAVLVLFEAGSMPIGQLGSALQLGKPAASLLVDALVQHGLVERVEDETDRRRTLTRLNPRAQELVARLHQGGRDRMGQWLAQLDEADLAALARGMSALVQAARADQPPPSC